MEIRGRERGWSSWKKRKNVDNEEDAEITCEVVIVPWRETDSLGLKAASSQ